LFLHGEAIISSKYRQCIPPFTKLLPNTNEMCYNRLANGICSGTRLLCASTGVFVGLN
jgi:hypothetical protein